MSISYNPKIVMDNLQLFIDYSNVNSNKTSSWTNMVTLLPTANNPAWTQNLEEFTCIVFLEVLGFDSSYARHPINKWAGTDNATFVLYHFQNFNGAGGENVFRWYANRGGLWGSISSGIYLSPGNIYMIGVQYHSSKGGLLWINGKPSGSRNGSGILANTTNNINIDSPQGSFPNVHRIKYCLMYNRELSNKEIEANFNAIRRRFGL